MQVLVGSGKAFGWLRNRERPLGGGKPCELWERNQGRSNADG